jgi:type I restriction enzyme, S subunit
MSNQQNIKFIPLSFISSEQELKRQIANTIVFSYLTNIYPQTNLNSYLVGTQYGFTASSAESGTHQMVRITDINDGSVDWKTVPYCDCNSEKNYLLKEDDILVARTGGTTGKSFLVKLPPDNAVFASYLIRLRTKKGVNIEFIHAFLNSYLYWSQISEMKSGSAQPNVNAEKLKTLLLPNCSFEVQNQIVELLKGGDFSEYPIVKQRLDDTLGNLERFKEIENESKTQSNLLSKLRQAYLQEAVMGKLREPSQDNAQTLLKAIKSQKAELIKQGKLRKEKPLAPIKPEEIPFEIPDNWVWCRLGEVCSKIGSGSTPQGSNYSSEGIPFFRSQNIYDDELRLDGAFYISAEVHKQMNGTVVLAEDILLNITGGSMGRCALVPNDFLEGNVSQHVCIIRPLTMDNTFFHKLVLSPYFQKLIFSSTTGAGREGLPKYNLERFLVPIPPLSEQKAIVAKVEGLLGNISLLESENKAQQIEVQRLMGAVLQEAFGGR